MATKKKTEVVEEPVVEAVEEVATEEKPKTTKKKSTSTKKKKVEEPVEVVEEVKEAVEVEPVVEAEPASEVKEEVKAEPKKEEKPVEKSKSCLYQVNAATGVYVFSGPGLDKAKVKVLPTGSKVTITETSGNWGKINKGWILMSPAIVEI